MGKPRFKPARVCSNPREFARVKTPAWSDSNILNPVETGWAIFQHRAAYVVLQKLNGTKKGIAALAGRLGEDPAWLTRKLHGQTPADLGDIIGWALALGVDVLPAFDESTELRTK